MRSSSEYVWPSKERSCNVYAVDVMAGILKPEKPFFAMRGGGIYALALTGGKPTHFIRMDKDRRPRRERKRMRRMAKQLVEATL